MASSTHLGHVHDATINMTIKLTFPRPGPAYDFPTDPGQDWELGIFSVLSPLLANKYQLLIHIWDQHMWACLLYKGKSPPLSAILKIPRSLPSTKQAKQAKRKGGYDTDEVKIAAIYGEASALYSPQSSPSQNGSWWSRFQEPTPHYNVKLDCTLKILEAPMETSPTPPSVVIKRHLKGFNNQQVCDVRFSIYLPTGARKTIFASSAVLEDVDYFVTSMLQSGFSESETSDLENEPHEVTWLDDDSDAEEDDVEGSIMMAGNKETINGKFRNIRVLDTTYANRFMLIEWQDTLLIQLRFSPRTYKALLLYLYTGVVDFVPLRSTFATVHLPPAAEKSDEPTPGTFDEPVAETKATMTFRQWCATSPSHTSSEMLNGYEAGTSPKSLYRLAHKLDMTALKEMCANQLALSFTPENIIAEIASPFFDTFATDLRHLYLNYLRQNRSAVIFQQPCILKKLLMGGPWSAEAAEVIDEALSLNKTQ